MQTVRFQMEKTMDELRRSPYNQQLGRNVSATFIVQQQGIKIVGLKSKFRSFRFNAVTAALTMIAGSVFPERNLHKIRGKNFRFDASPHDTVMSRNSGVAHA